jgi:hypothetical protein
MPTPNMLDLARAAAADEDADILLLNAPMGPGVDKSVRDAIGAREDRRSHVVVILVTPGGLADTAYRCATALQNGYERVTVCVAGWCKSAGTLLAVGANELIVGTAGEMGPLDVQIAKRDDLGGDRDSGLILNEALERLRDESFGMFESFMIRMIAQSQNNVTFRTAADIAAQMTIGLMQPVFDKIDPIRMGADARAMNIGRDYAIRLNMRASNLQGDVALNMLLNGYPSHGFAIDNAEARRLFTRVKDLDGSLALLIGALGELALNPRTEALISYLDGDDDAEADDEIDADPDVDGPEQQPAEEPAEQPPEEL